VHVRVAVSDTLRIGQLAVRTGKTRRTLHFYEELGLLQPSTRTDGGFRKYDESAITRIHWIERLQEMGFSLPEVREFLDTLQGWSHGPEAMGVLRDFYDARQRETQTRIDQLQQLSAELERSLAWLSVCRTCAPKTPRLICCQCDEHDNEPPPLVSAIHDPAPES
jgi:DNA-binding transcriptional MerR regulator